MIPLVHSHFSLMRGTASPAELCRAARDLGHASLALTDRDNLYGLWPFLQACEAEGLTPILGAELTEPCSDQCVQVLVKNETGFRNLCRLISQRHLDPHFSLCENLIQHAEGLLFLADAAGLLASLHAAHSDAMAAIRGQSGDSALLSAARQRNLPSVAAPPVFFSKPADHALHRLFRAIDLNTSLSRLKPGELSPSRAYLASPAEYAQRFENFPETLLTAQQLSAICSFRGPSRQPVLPPWSSKDGLTHETELRQSAYFGAHKRYGSTLPEAVKKRLEHELGVIAQKGFSSYFLVVQDIIARSPRICGRGSGAASLVAYCLGITNVCPIKHNLYFERFLNPGRSDPPDIDVDFAWDERDNILESVLTQYTGHAAMVCNQVAFQPRMAIREVAKVYGLTDREINQVAKRLPWLWHDDENEEDLQNRLEALPELKNLDFPDPWPEILCLAQRLIGTPRYISVHSGGMVITPQPIDNYVPVERAPKGVPILQWEKDGTEDSGLVKIDLLGNRSLGVIRDAIAMIREQGKAFDEFHWEPEDDPATQQAVAAGKTMGCFYIESPATRLLQQKAGVGDFEHLVIHSSIIRPAANIYIREYLRRLKGGTWEPLHPLLTHVLDETFGIMVYQEDVSKTAVALAGFTHAEADGLRKILCKKNRAPRLRDYKNRFWDGALARGVTENQIQAIWDMILSFSGYSFCKPHSASYARVSFQAAYLKVHYPAEFMAAVISNQGGFYSTFAYVSEARRLGITVLNPDINESGLRWQGWPGFIRVGLQSIESLSLDTQKRIVMERRKARFRDLNDFLHRIAPNQEEGRALIHAGAFDSLVPGADRASLVWELATQQKPKTRKMHIREIQELPGLSLTPVLPPIPVGEEIDQLRLEFKTLGFLCDRHPMTLFAKILSRQKIIKAINLKEHIGKRIKTAGWLITAKLVPTRQGEVMEFITFEDETGLMETTFFPETYHRVCDQLNRNRPFILRGLVEEEFGAVTLTVDGIEALF